jgi:hypothetical protein
MAWLVGSSSIGLDGPKCSIRKGFLGGVGVEIELRMVWFCYTLPLLGGDGVVWLVQ